ncbi:MAG: FliA/WhiG family RNA polymerase sigma factor [Defluviitaleaceae bacterium]|nr:FliA/WhiG family RNA polymerase sigma factor [Defluviitaleaceae bacterium]
MTSIENVWQEYIANKSPALKEKLILHYAPLVKYVAGRLIIHVGQHVEFDDLMGYGIFGLIDAIEKYDNKKGVKFETYASFRIRGAIIDQIRMMDWVPRTHRQKNKQLEKAYSQLEEQLGRPPTDGELAERLEISVEETQELIRKSSVVSLISLNEYMEQNYETTLAPLVANRSESPEEQTEINELQDILAQSIDKLTEKEKLVITLYYYEDLTLKEISSIMKVTESRISQIHTGALAKLKGRLGRFKSALFA